MSTPTRGAGVMATPSSVSASNPGSSTRDAILQRYGIGRSDADGKASQMECFQSADPVESASVADVVSASSGRSDRALLVSAGKKVGALGTLGAHSEDVEVGSMKPRVAFQSFAGALYRGGPGASHGVFETGTDLLVAGSASSATAADNANDKAALSLKFESPFVRLSRLQQELAEFHGDLTAASAAQSQVGAAGAGDDAWSSLGTSVAQLQGQLDGILAQPQFQSLLADGNASASVAGGNAGAALLPQFDTLFGQYVAALEADANFVPQFDATEAASPSTAAAVPTSADLSVAPKLDARLAVLERFVGLNGGASTKQPPAGSLLSFASSAPGTGPASSTGGASVSVLPAPDLVSSLASLHAQLSALNPQRLEFVGRAVKAILIEQEAMQLNAKQSKEEDGASGAAAAGVAPKKEETPNSTTPAFAAQVAHLFALTDRWDALALGLPSLISRLSSLHTLHAASSSLVSRVASLEAASSAIESSVRAQAAGQQQLQTTALENLSQMRDNFTAMERRMEEITKKMEQIRTK